MLTRPNAARVRSPTMWAAGSWRQAISVNNEEGEAPFDCAPFGKLRVSKPLRNGERQTRLTVSTQFTIGVEQSLDVLDGRIGLDVVGSAEDEAAARP